MFRTFRHLQSDSGHGQYVLESTASPFDKPSNRISRLACVYCRSKKVKCTGEEHGCQRCLDKQIACSYISPGRPEIDTAPRRLPRLQHVTKGLHDDIRRQGDEIATQHDGSKSSLNIGSQTIMTDSDLLDMDFNLAQSVTDHDEHSSYDNSTSLFFDDLQESNSTTAPAFGATVNSNVLTHRADASGSDEHNTTSPASPSRANCLCSEMVDVYETVECLAWAQRTSSITSRSTCIMTQTTPPSPISNDELMCQKEVLKSCEKWLNEDASHIQSRHAVLMISILERLLTSILSLASLPRDWKDDYAVASSVLSVEAHHSLQVDQWKMSDEERIHLFKSLLDFRASRLKGLLERLGAIAASNRWQMQINMVKRLLDRLPKHRDLL